MNSDLHSHLMQRNLDEGAPIEIAPRRMTVLSVVGDRVLHSVTLRRAPVRYDLRAVV